MICPNCKGEGVTERPARPAGEKPTAADGFPMLCGICNGTGQVKAKPPATEGQDPEPAV